MCACITWPIVDNRRSFFGQTPVASDFAAGTSFDFSVIWIHNANPIQRATFPRKWLSHSIADSPYSVPPAGQPPNYWGNLAPMPALAPASSPCPAPSTPKKDTRNPKIKLLMDPYLKCYNNFLNLLEILTSLGKGMTDLPSLPQYCQPTGQPFLGWNSILGKCFWGAGCKYFKGPLKKGDATDTFVDAISECISKGVLYYTNLPAGASLPRSKQKGGGATPEP